MTPQDRFVIVAPVLRDVHLLRRDLAGMTLAGYPGLADPCNAIVPFCKYETIHFARFVVLEDNTLQERAAYPQLLRYKEPIYLCFMVDCDDSACDLLSQIARECPRLHEIFEYCGLDRTGNLAEWMQAHRVRPSTSYVNWIGRTVTQAREEAKLHAELRKALPNCDAGEPQALLSQLRGQVSPELTSPAPTPLSWRVRNLVHFYAPLVAAALCLLLFPLLTLALLVAGLAMFVVALRRHEQSDPIIDWHPPPALIAQLSKGEDHDVTNQYTAIGSAKPGRFRGTLQLAIFYALDWVARHICTHGRLGRISTIHFAHWIYLDNRRRGFFCSNYDGGHEAYMDDFINKAGFGLNFAFSGAIGYPGTDWLFAKGAWREQEFKRFQRRHQIPTDVWYKAYPGLTAHDLARNSRIRNGFEKRSMSDDEIRRWLAEI
jgi:hypothetical protein